MTTTTKQKIKKTLLSTKFWVTLWAMVLVSYVIFANKTEMINLVTPLSFAPMVYCGLNVWQKNILNKSDSTDTTETTEETNGK